MQLFVEEGLEARDELLPEKPGPAEERPADAHGGAEGPEPAGAAQPAAALEGKARGKPPRHPGCCAPCSRPVVFRPGR